MVTVGLLVRLHARPGTEGDVETFLRDALPIVQAEPATAGWFALRFADGSFGIFDVFADEDGRRAHLAGRVAAALSARAEALLGSAPRIEAVDVLAATAVR